MEVISIYIWIIYSHKLITMMDDQNNISRIKSTDDDYLTVFSKDFNKIVQVPVQAEDLNVCVSSNKICRRYIAIGANPAVVSVSEFSKTFVKNVEIPKQATEQFTRRLDQQEERTFISQYEMETQTEDILEEPGQQYGIWRLRDINENLL